MTDSYHDQIKEAAESSLLNFIRLVAPHRVLGACHEELIQWWYREGAGTHQMALLPRDHQKSVIMAYRVAFELTKDPSLTFLYISATSKLAEKQLRFIKNIFTSKVYQRYWPDMVSENKSDREKWNQKEIILDHPSRISEGVADASVYAAGLTTGITGFHFNIAVLDDVVVDENASTQGGRDKVLSQYSLLASIESGMSAEWIVGTRYDPRDLYHDLIEMEEEVYNDKGDLVSSRPVYEVMQREVEDRGDGTGEFLWPVQTRADGKMFGFNIEILARKRAKYLDKAQFRAQYYNNPNDPDSNFIDREKFQYYEKRHLTQDGGNWYYNNARLNVYAAIDFAFSLRKKADYTAIVVVGIDAEKNIYVLDVLRFKTDKISVYFDNIMEAHMLWGFRKIRAEVTVAQQAIVKELKEVYIKQHGLALAVDEYRPTRSEGSKEERMAAILEPRYANGYVWHYKGGYCQVLEEELVMKRPPHDDIKDTLAAAIDVAIAPTFSRNRSVTGNVIPIHPRFGGVL